MIWSVLNLKSVCVYDRYSSLAGWECRNAKLCDFVKIAQIMNNDWSQNRTRFKSNVFSLQSLKSCFTTKSLFLIKNISVRYSGTKI